MMRSLRTTFSYRVRRRADGWYVPMTVDQRPRRRVLTGAFVLYAAVTAVVHGSMIAAGDVRLGTLLPLIVWPAAAALLVVATTSDTALRPESLATSPEAARQASDIVDAYLELEAQAKRLRTPEARQRRESAHDLTREAVTRLFTTESHRRGSRALSEVPSFQNHPEQAASVAAQGEEAARSARQEADVALRKLQAWGRELAAK